MEFSDLIQKRKSIRKFISKEINEQLEKEILSKILIAPSAGNLQAFKILIVKNSNIKKQIWKFSHEQDPLLKAPLILVFIADKNQSAQRYGDRGRELYSIQDATIATLYAHLIVADSGLGSVWIGAFNTKKVHSILNLDKNKVPVAILPIGYYEEEPNPRSRRNLSEMVVYYN